ncbi:MAG: hypothetical protein WC518_02400 [Patescibacteria group bacterium]
MLFLLLRVFSWLIPLVYFFAIRGLIYYFDKWYLFLALALVLDLVYFILIKIKTTAKGSWLAFLHSLVFVSVGFIYFLFLSGSLPVAIFSFGWPILYLIYLESVFHFFYQTKKVFLLDFKNIVSYLNLIILFFGSVVLINFYTFINFNLFGLSVVFLLGCLILLSSRFFAEGYNPRTNVFQSLVLALLLWELFLVLTFLPLSIYALALILSLAYYLLTSFALRRFNKNLTTLVVLQYSLFAGLVLIIVLVTAAWL